MSVVTLGCKPHHKEINHTEAALKQPAPKPSRWELVVPKQAPLHRQVPACDLCVLFALMHTDLVVSGAKYAECADETALAPHVMRPNDDDQMSMSPLAYPTRLFP